MKKVLLTAVAVAFLATSAFAQAPAKKGMAKTPAATRMSGAIVKADATSLTLKVKGKDESFAITADTKVKQGTKDITAADLKAGENATVTYTKAGEAMTATAITVKAAAPAKKVVEKAAAPAKKR